MGWERKAVESHISDPGQFDGPNGIDRVTDVGYFGRGVGWWVGRAVQICLGLILANLKQLIGRTNFIQILTQVLYHS